MFDRLRPACSSPAMPSPPKRPALARLLASLRSSRASAPVQTGFPTSLADIVVRNHARLRKPRRPRRPAAAVAPPPSPPRVASLVEVVDEELTPPPPPPPTQPLSPVAVQRLDAPQVFRLRPDFLAVGGAVALALLVVWGEGAVAAFTVAALSLLWIESASRRPRPIRDAEEGPRRSSFSDSDEGSQASTPGTPVICELFAAGGGDGDPTTPKRNGKRSLRKILSKKLRKKREPEDSSDPSSSSEQPDAAGRDADEALPPFSDEQTPSESSTEWSSSSSSSSEPAVEGRGGVKVKGSPLAWFVPVILAGLVAGKLLATALAVLCMAFFSAAVKRVQ